MIKFLHANTPLGILFMFNPIASMGPGSPSSAWVISHGFQKGKNAVDVDVFLIHGLLLGIRRLRYPHPIGVKLNLKNHSLPEPKLSIEDESAFSPAGKPSGRHAVRAK
jgi:hypothetical protein